MEPLFVIYIFPTCGRERRREGNKEFAFEFIYNYENNVYIYKEQHMIKMKRIIITQEWLLGNSMRQINKGIIEDINIFYS